KVDEGESPEMDVNVDYESGEMPEYDVDWANVDVSTTTKTVEVPKVRVVMEEEEVEVASLDVNIPDDDRPKMQQTLMVEVQVSERMGELEIEKVYASKNMLYVIAELEEEDEELGDQTVRLTDQIEINAPELDVKYYIIGDKPMGDYNNKYRFIRDEDEIADRLEGAQVIYED
ncbi:MAG TPA: hypothetical protein VJ949_07010, partial [Cryomorphaceae bacterium]|nr:hypothetical protein [Cryomorphaceae bacterium]